MPRRFAHLLLVFLLSTPADAAVCGAVARKVTLVSVDPHGEIRFGDGERARLGGLALAPAARAVVADLANRRFGLAPLSPRPDRWGRLIVDLADESGESVALDLLLRGLARVTPEYETRDCASERLEAEAAARAAEEGIWAAAGAVIAASDRAALDAADGRFVLVAGAVRRVGVGRAKVYLDFASRGGFSAVVARKAEPLFRRRGIDLRALAGRRVLVRGVLDDRFGPRIEVADPAMIEPQQGAAGAQDGAPSAKETKRAE